MYEVVLPEGGINNPGALLRAIVVTLYSYWTRAEAYQKFGYVIGVLLIGSAVFHTGVLIVTGGSLEGPVSWRKPILFGESFGLTAFVSNTTMALVDDGEVLGSTQLEMGNSGLDGLIPPNY